VIRIFSFFAFSVAIDVGRTDVPFWHVLVSEFIVFFVLAQLAAEPWI